MSYTTGNGGNGLVIISEYQACVAGEFFSTSSERCEPCPSGWTSSPGDLTCYNFLDDIRDQLVTLKEQVSRDQNLIEKLREQMAQQAKDIKTLKSDVRELKKNKKRSG
jgi:hypothetical protein